MNKADRAEELFRKGYNCSQSVFVAFAEELGMSEEEAARTEEYYRSRPFVGACRTAAEIVEKYLQKENG